MQDLTVTFIQSNLVWNDFRANLLTFSEKLNAVSEKTDLVVLPEMFNTAFVVEPETVDKEAAHISLDWMIRNAQKYDTAICGSMIVNEEGNYYNRFYWVEPNGNIQKYDKRHLFTLGNEHLKITAGQENIIIEYKGWKIKPLVCYDLRFPVWAKNTYANGQYEYDLLIYVANWPAARNYAWKSLLVARAIENQAYVVGVNRIGPDANGTKHTGFSSIIEPKGELISEEVENIESSQTISLSAVDMNTYREKFTIGIDWDEFSVKKNKPD
ncbi:MULTISPECIES: amidohydrolase [unclassified Lentimicrobium]|uniref:amidohydrolase n=1 Tax=unclassified Lentimicrobium TaxID=2677434 RepID=UPI00155581A8|nr:MULTISPECIES: amidohydrolase [unclassified Lentimicrobium]NPD44454.1 amidohydrolase [Lentimicrobium sp. S6]NPD83358.1 amidohydrolase [Lentimicrobium sp. L6]